MVIDADQELIFQPLQPGALHAVTFQDDGGIVIAIYLYSMCDGFRMRQRLVDDWDGIGQDDISSLAHLAQNLGERER